MSLKINKKIVILYHGKCPDGFSGAWVAWKKFGDSAEYVPMPPGSDAPDIEGKEVYCIDYIPDDVSGLKEFISRNKFVIAIDHHVSNESSVPLFTDSKFDKNKCGSMLAWEYFFPKQPVPILLKYVQDVDLWQWQLSNSKEFALYVDTVDFTFPVWEQLRSNFEDEKFRADIIRQAQLLIKDKDKHIRNSIEDDAQLVMFEGLEILAINATADGSFMGNALIELRPPMAIVWAESKNDIHVGLRSNGDVDVSAIAKKYGGGGHQKASGFSWPLGKEKPWKIIKKDEK